MTQFVRRDGFCQSRCCGIPLEDFTYAAVCVSTTYYLTDSEVTMIYAVGTLSEFRKRGYARRTMEAAIKHAWQQSEFPIALYASEMGHALYTSMGFKDLYSLEQYLYSPSAGEI